MHVGHGMDKMAFDFRPWSCILYSTVSVSIINNGGGVTILMIFSLNSVNLIVKKTMNSDISGNFLQKSQKTWLWVII
jgi:hypothetical protein